MTKNEFFETMEEHFGKKIKIICMDGQIVVGILMDYTSALDNEPDPESVTVDEESGFMTEVYLHEVGTVERTG